MASDNSALDILQAFTKGTDQVVFAYDIPSKRFTFLNPAFEKLWGKSRKRVIRKINHM